MFVLMTSGMTDLDREKFNKIYHLYASFVYRVALKELSETELAQDCTQAAFERIIKYMETGWRSRILLRSRAIFIKRCYPPPQICADAKKNMSQNKTMSCFIL